MLLIIKNSVCIVVHLRKHRTALEGDQQFSYCFIHSLLVTHTKSEYFVEEGSHFHLLHWR